MLFTDPWNTFIRGTILLEELEELFFCQSDLMETYYKNELESLILEVLKQLHLHIADQND